MSQGKTTPRLTQKEYLLNAMFERAELRAMLADKPRGHYLANADGSRAYMVLKDRLGAPYAVYRDVTLHIRNERYPDMQKVRAAHGVGRPPRTRLYPPSQGAYYGIGPGMAALPLVRRLNKLPPAERAYAAARFVESRLGA